eukprot:1196138-Prorocentrum_minimum.AAC.11
MRNSTATSVLLPLPVRPTTPSFSDAATDRCTPHSTRCSSGRYLKRRIRKAIGEFNTWSGQYLCLEWSGVEWSGLEWSGVEWVALHYTEVKCSQVHWTGLDWTGLDWTARWSQPTYHKITFAPVHTSNASNMC